MFGDFNAIISNEERKGGIRPHKLSCEEFHSWCNNSGMMDIPTRGQLFTWTNGRKGRQLIDMRLDKGV